MLCCKKAEGAAQAQTDNKMDCHKSESGEKSNPAKQCSGCKSCVNANIISTSQRFETIAVSAIRHTIPDNTFVSVLPGGIDNPPKPIS